MQNYTAKDIEQMFGAYRQHIRCVIVAHTKHRPYVCSVDSRRYASIRASRYLQHKLQQTSKDARYALNCFEKLLYPDASNKPVRRPDLYKPLCFTTIEGARETTDRSKTIHVNIALGNLPTVLSITDIETLFRHAWLTKANQRDDIEVRAYDLRNWVGYTLKEVQQQPSRAWDEHSVWDVSNCWIPHSALKAD
jgi:hypothetical protein